MTQLYKYMSGEGALRLFRSGLLRFTQPVEFNDPFEMQPFIKGLADEPTLENQFRDGFGQTLEPQIDEMLSKLDLTAEQRAKIDRKALCEGVQSQAPEALGLFKMFAQVMTPLVSQQIYKTANQNLGALCLGEEPTNLLMWAHYADHHRGVVIEFDSSHNFFNRRHGSKDDFRHFRKVVYTEQRPALFLTDSDAVDFFYFKSKEWEYEREWRLIVPLVGSSRKIERGLDYPICLFEFPQECIRSVLVGCRMPEIQKLELSRELRNRTALRHIRMEQAELDPRVFALCQRIVDDQELDNWLTKTEQQSSPVLRN